MFVSYSMGSIQDLCYDAVWMHKGELRKWGEAEEVVDAYTSFLEVGEDALTMEDV